MTPNPLLHLRNLLVALFTQAELDMFVVLYLNKAEVLPGAGLSDELHAYKVARALERRGYLTDAEFWKFMVLDRPRREEEIRTVQFTFIPPPTRSLPPSSPPQAPAPLLSQEESSSAPRRQHGRGQRPIRSIEDIYGPRISLSNAAAYRRAYERPLLEVNRALDQIARVSRMANRLVDFSQARWAIEIRDPFEDFERVVREAVKPTMATDALAALLPRG